MFSPEVIRWFGYWKDSNKIQGVGLDLDDCLLRVSGDTFRWGFGRYFSTILAQRPDLNIEELRKSWKLANIYKYEHVGVRRDRWDLAVEYLASCYRDVNKGVFEAGAEILNTDMYQRVPRWCPGAREAVELFRASGLAIAVVTHSDQVWTETKTIKNGVKDLIDEIVVADPAEFRTKTREHWREGLARIGVRPERAMGAGDNKKTDIWEMREVGVINLGWVRSVFLVYGEGNLPNGVPTLRNLGRWVTYLAKCEAKRNGVRLKE
jgi:FMN phosphatase YigB (HAD superfamily)